MINGSTVRRVLLSGFVLTAAASTVIVGGAAAAPSSPEQAPVSQPATRLEAVVLDQGDRPPAQPAGPASGVPRRPLLVVQPAVPAAKVTPKVAAKMGGKPAAKMGGKPASKPASRPGAADASGGGSALSRAVARIPGYSAYRPTRWVLTGKYGHWGATDLSSGTVYISPSVPASRLDDVVRHEWAHVLTIRIYGSASATISGLNAYFGGSGMAGGERATDCMARQLGATWTGYTSCSSAAWQRGAVRLLQGRRP